MNASSRLPQRKSILRRTKPLFATAILLLSFCLFAFGSFSQASASVLPARDLSHDGALSHRAQDSFVRTESLWLAAQGERRSDSSNHKRQLAEWADLSKNELITLLQHHLNVRSSAESTHVLAKRNAEELSKGQLAGYAVLVPILVILSGIFAGLTLGYMSLDETQLQVLASTGTEKQQAYARKIIPVRKDGHLLLTTLLIANMITNETLPIISDPLFPTPVLAVVVSTILVIIFAELVPQSICSRYGLEIGAHMAVPTRIVMIALWPVAFPVSRVLHWTLGPHHGIVYRRAELKELVTMHAASGGRGGDLKGDTVMMVGGALDLQEKVVGQAMTPIDKVFMLPSDAKLDYPTLQRIVRSGHSRIPVYQEIEVSVNPTSGANTPSKRSVKLLNALTRRNTSNSSKQQAGGVPTSAETLNEKSGSEATGNLSPKQGGGAVTGAGLMTVKRKNIVGTLLVKSCVLLDPEDAVPVSEMTINALPTVPSDEPLHNVLNAFQEGRSHMAIVTSMSRLDAALDTSSSMLIKPHNQIQKPTDRPALPQHHALSEIDEEAQLETGRPGSASSGGPATSSSHTETDDNAQPSHLRRFWRKHFSSEAQLEQSVPSDAQLSENTFAHEDSQPAPARGDILGIITLEDVLEELIGEEIYDEYDPHEGGDTTAWNDLTPPLSPKDEFGGRNDGPATEKMPSGDEATMLPPAALSDEKGSQVAPAPTRTLLGRLGLGGRGKGGSSSPAPSREVGPPPSSPAPMMASPVLDESTKEAADPLDIDPSTGEKDYFNSRGHAASTDNGSKTGQGAAPARLGSAPNDLLLNPSHPGTAPHSRPTTPGANLGQPSNRPIVLRKTLVGGGTQNIIVGENMLRGRNVAPGVPVVTMSASAAGQASKLDGPEQVVTTMPPSVTTVAPTGSAVRSSTPKPNRFKSTPVNANTASSGVGPATNQAGSVAAVSHRIRSRSASAEPSNPSSERSTPRSSSAAPTGASPQTRGSALANTSMTADELTQGVDERQEVTLTQSPEQEQPQQP